MPILLWHDQFDYTEKSFIIKAAIPSG